jgi:hypothetical protein
MFSLYYFTGIINVYVFTCALGKYFSSKGEEQNKQFSGKDAEGLKELL